MRRVSELRTRIAGVRHTVTVSGYLDILGNVKDRLPELLDVLDNLTSKDPILGETERAREARLAVAERCLRRRS